MDRRPEIDRSKDLLPSWIAEDGPSAPADDPRDPRPVLERRPPGDGPCNVEEPLALAESFLAEEFFRQGARTAADQPAPDPLRQGPHLFRPGDPALPVGHGQGHRIPDERRRWRRLPSTSPDSCCKIGGEREELDPIEPKLAHRGRVAHVPEKDRGIPLRVFVPSPKDERRRIDVPDGNGNAKGIEDPGQDSPFVETEMVEREDKIRLEAGAEREAP